MLIYMILCMRGDNYNFLLIDRFMCIDIQIKKFCTLSRQCYSWTYTDDTKREKTTFFLHIHHDENSPFTAASITYPMFVINRNSSCKHIFIRLECKTVN